jgi:hypothetical protein
MAPVDRDSGTRPLISFEVWHLVVVLVGVAVLAGHFLLGASLPKLGQQELLVLALLVVLVLLLVLRARKRSGG